MDALHRRASQWYEDQGLELDAFHHATAGQDIERAERLIEGQGLPLHYRGGAAPVLAWLKSLPATTLNAWPALRVAVRQGTSTLYFLLGDHLGSTSITADGSSGAYVSEVRYMPFGRDRYTNGTTPTTYRFTGQRQEAGLGPDPWLGGLYYFNARWMDPLVGRFAAADNIVPEPGNPQSLNRFTFALNNPLRFTDPTGHCSGDPADTQNPDLACWQMIELIQSSYGNVTVDSANWTTDELMGLKDALDLVLSVLGDSFSKALGRMRFKRQDVSSLGEGVTGIYSYWSGDITMFDAAFGDPDAVFYILHEIGHSFDYANTYKNGFTSWFSPNRSFSFGEFWSGCGIWLAGRCNRSGRTTVTGTVVRENYSKSSTAEDFADTFAVSILEVTGRSLPSWANSTDDRRRQVMYDLFALAVEAE